MSTVAKKQAEKTYDPISEGLHPATCVAVVDLGEQHNKQFDKDQHKVLLMFEIHDETLTIEGEEKPRVISETYTLSLNEKANLRQALESWRGKKFTDEESEGFDVKNVLGKPCQINVAHSEKDGKTYTNIMSIVPWPRNAEKEEAESELLYYDMDDTNRELVLSKLPEWIQKKIKESKSYDFVPADEEVPDFLKE